MHLLTWIIVGMVWSMIFQLRTSKQSLIDFFDIHGEREKTKKMKKHLNRKTFQINLKRNDWSVRVDFQFPIFMNKQYIVGSPEGKIYSRMFRIYYIPLLKLLVLRVLKDDAE